jgi:hypothetical protein
MTCSYSGGLFGCFKDIPICLCSIICAPWIYTKTTAKTRGEKCGIFHCCNPIAPWYHRKDCGKEKGFGNDCLDCLISIFLCPCSLCQNARSSGVKPFELG